MNGNKYYFDYLVIAGGKVPDQKFCRQVMRRSTHLVTVDRGIVVAKNLKLKPILHVGDGDSVDSNMVSKVNPTSVIKLPPKKAISDLEYAINLLPKTSKKIVLGAHRDHEGRTDHLYVNLLIAQKYPNLVLADENNWITSISRSKLSFSVSKKTLFTVTSFNRSKISVKGSEYNLKNKVFYHPSLGLSNRTLDEWVQIQSRGLALIFVSSNILNARVC